MAPILYLVVPCYNEEEVLPVTAARLHAILRYLIDGQQVSPESRILFVDDGSTDRTWERICQMADGDSHYAAVSLSRNFGHQNALLAGLMEARLRCQASISMDADLQDDPEIIPLMLEQFSRGFDIVYGVRRDRSCDTVWKHATASAFYRLAALLGIRITPHAGDFRLMSRRALDGLSLFHEHNPFLRGIVPLLGYPSCCVPFDRSPRRAGRSKYSLRRMVSFALDGILSFSLTPLRLILPAGLVMLCAAPILPPGRLIWLACAILMCAVGILALYAGRIYTELLDRPRYLIRETRNLPPET